MAKKQFSRGDVLVYFTGSPSQRREPSVLKDVEKIELWKFFSGHVPEERRRDLTALIERMCESPTYAFAKDVARDFGRGGVFARVGFTANLTLMVDAGLLINPVGGVFGLSPKTLLQTGLLDEFLGRASTCTATEIWQWVRDEILKIEATQTQMKQLGINPWKSEGTHARTDRRPILPFQRAACAGGFGYHRH